MARYKLILQPAIRYRVDEIFHVAVGFAAFHAPGSDLGAGVVQQLALAHPEALVGVHMGGTNPYIGRVPDNLTAVEQKFVANAQRWQMAEMADAMEHASKHRASGWSGMGRWTAGPRRTAGATFWNGKNHNWWPRTCEPSSGPCAEWLSALRPALSLGNVDLPCSVGALDGGTRAIRAANSQTHRNACRSQS
jgi:pimeloyl-ACP methyl ester carboxylesterase